MDVLLFSNSLVSGLLLLLLSHRLSVDGLPGRVIPRPGVASTASVFHLLYVPLYGGFFEPKSFPEQA